MTAARTLPTTLIDPTDRRTALGLAAILTGLTGLVAIIVWIVGPVGARESLGFTFEGIPHRPGEVASILVNNLRLLAVVLGACLVVQLLAQSRGHGGMESAVALALVTLCDGLLLIAGVAHVVLVGAGLGGHGGRMVKALLPHAPLELAAYSLALALYLAARSGPIGWRRGAGVGAVSGTLLLVGAVVEVYFQL